MLKFSDSTKKNLTNFDPKLIFLAQEVNEGNKPATHFTIWCATNLKDCEVIFKWLLKNKLVGDSLCEFIYHENQGSFLSASNCILSFIKREKNYKQTLGDWR